MAGRNLPFWVAVWLLISSILVTIDALFVILRPRTLPGGKWNYLFPHYNIYIHVDKRYADLNDTFNYGQSFMNLAEMCLNIIALIMYNKGKVGLSVLVAFMVSTMTFSKTVFYFLVSSELCGGQHFVNHNDWKSAVFLYIIPNGIWIVVPFLSMVATGKIIVDCTGNGQTSGKKTKSN